MAAKRAGAAKKKTTAKKATKAKAKKAAPKKKRSTAPAPATVVKKPKKPAKANKAPAIPHQKTIYPKAVVVPPKPKATISRAKAVLLANTFLKANIGHGALHAPRTARFRLGSIVDRSGIINILFCHEADDQDETVKALGAKCLDALVTAHPQLRAFDLEVQTVRM